MYAQISREIVMVKRVSCLVAAAMVGMSLASAYAQTPADSDDSLRVKTILQHMQRTPFAPKYVPPGFSGEPLRLRRSGPDAPVQIVEARLAPGGQIAFQLLSRPQAEQVLSEFGGAPMMGRAYTATPNGTLDLQATGRRKLVHVRCWVGRGATSAQPQEDLCAAAVDPDVIMVATVQADPAGGITAGSAATLRVRSLASEGLSYWTAIDDQMETEFLQKLVN